MAKIIARDGRGILLHLTNEDLAALGVSNCESSYYRDDDSKAATILSTVIREHRDATRLILAYGDLPTILHEALAKLHRYAEARTKLVLAAVAPKDSQSKKGRAA